MRSVNSIKEYVMAGNTLLRKKNGKRERNTDQSDEDLEEFMPLSKRINNLHLTQDFQTLSPAESHMVEMHQREEIMSSIGSPSRINEIMGYPVFTNPTIVGSGAGPPESALGNYSPNEAYSVVDRYSISASALNNGQRVQKSETCGIHKTHEYGNLPRSQCTENEVGLIQNQVHPCHPNAEPVPIPECAKSRQDIDFQESQYMYAPKLLTEGASPFYYQQNRQLFYLYLDRMKRNNLLPHPYLHQNI